jgi:hypothetical protein
MAIPITSFDRAQELLDWSTETGLPLPMEIERILEFEDLGHVVDLETGEVMFHGAEATYGLTVLGEALVIVEATNEQAA